MFLTGFLTALYMLVAAFAASMTYSEQCQTDGRGSLYTALGFLACVFWPVTFLGVAVAARRQAT